MSFSYENSITERCVQLAGMLRELRNRADGDEDARIGDLLMAVRANSSIVGAMLRFQR